MAALTLNINESLKIRDERRAAGRCVVSDILIGTGDMTDAEFAALLDRQSAVGYEDFRWFIPGDYEFKDALFRAVLSSDSGSQPRLMTLANDIDVPDITDSGTATASAAGPVVVMLNRAFNVVVEIHATLKGGTVVAVPRCTPIDKTSFSLELIDPSNTRVAGTVSWSAKGY